MIITKENISSLVPQRSPFLMIDTLLSADDHGAVSAFEIKDDNVLLSGNRLSAPGLVENMAQTAAAHAGYAAIQSGNQVQVGFIGAINDLEITGFPGIGETIETTIVIKTQVFNVTIIHGESRLNGLPIASCDMKIFIQ